MRLEEVKKLSAEERLLYWIMERESIRLKKEAGEPKPYTEDTILQRFRFCNVRRMDDKVSRWLWNNFYRPYRDNLNTLAVVALCRFINLPSSLEAIEQELFSHKKIPWDRIKKKLRKLKERGTVFNSAYMVRGNDGVDKIESVIDYNVRPLEKLKKQVDPSSMQATWKAILPSYGLGSFMAGQIVADLRWALTGTWADKYDWAPLGPGSQRGLNRLYDFGPKAPQSRDEFRGMLDDTIERLKGSVPPTIAARLEAMDYQNCLCEYDKYCRVLNSEGRPKSRYPGV